MKVAVDTTYTLGRGTVKDTYNLLSDGIVKLVRALAEVDRSDLDEWTAAQGYRSRKRFGALQRGSGPIDESRRCGLNLGPVVDSTPQGERVCGSWIKTE